MAGKLQSFRFVVLVLFLDSVMVFSTTQTCTLHAPNYHHAMMKPMSPSQAKPNRVIILLKFFTSRESSKSKPQVPPPPAQMVVGNGINLLGINALLVPTSCIFFHFGPYIFISPLLVPTSINAFHFGPYHNSLNRNCCCGKRSALLAH